MLSIDGTIVACQVDGVISGEVEMVQVDALPGSDEDDGWCHFVPGQAKWGVSERGFFSEDDLLLQKQRNGNVKGTVTVEIGDQALTGGVMINQVDVSASMDSLVKMNVDMTGEDMPAFVQQENI